MDDTWRALVDAPVVETTRDGRAVLATPPLASRRDGLTLVAAAEGGNTAFEGPTA